MAEVDNKQLPEIPTKRPKQIHDKKLKKGRRRTQKYIEENKIHLTRIELIATHSKCVILSN
jgi:hypothetical protein